MSTVNPQILDSIKYLSSKPASPPSAILVENLKNVSYLHAIALKMGVCPKHLLTLNEEQVYNLILQKLQ